MPKRVIDHVHNPEYSAETLSAWITDIEEGGRGVTDWEQGFVESCKEALESGRRLSEKQIKILERVYTERT